MKDHDLFVQRVKASLGIIVVVFHILWSNLLINPVFATVSACTVTVVPTSLPKNTTNSLIFAITNGDSGAYNWVKITRPNFRFTINSGDSDNWDNQPTSSAIIFSSGGIAAGATSIFTINLTTADMVAASANWVVQTSDDGGSTIANCTGTVGVAINDGQHVPATIANLTASNITSTTATVSWNSSFSSTSEINYGLDTSYGSSSSNAIPSLSHSYSLVGLSPSTTYYYEASIVDDLGNIATEANQFTTDVDPLAQSSTPVITNATVSEITSSSVVISWTTDISSNSVINYGTSNSYGQTALDATLTTSHSVTLTGLSSSTTYHYQIQSTSDNNIGSTADNTFTTSASTTPTPTPTSTPTPTNTPTSTNTPTPTPTTAAGSPTNTPTPTPTTTSTTTPTQNSTTTTQNTPTPVPRDTISPKITLTANVTKPYTTAPQMSVIATDDKGLLSVSYSFDGGNNWLPVEGNTFTPPVKEDGNYKIRVKAIDTSGNISYSEEKVLVIDRLPPRVGGNVLSLGPEVLFPMENGRIILIEGLDQKVTLSSVGGATAVDLITDSLTDKQMFSLVKTPQSTLWSGALSFSNPGAYKLNVRSVDGAGHRVERSYNDVVVLQAGSIQGKKGPIQDATVSLYYQNPSTKFWTLWDGSAHNQLNPQITDSLGRYRLHVPAGKYYMKVTAKGSRTLVSNIFTVEKASPINSVLHINSSPRIKIGSFELVFPDIFQDTAKINFDFEKQLNQIKSSNLAGRKIYPFTLPQTTGSTFDSKSLYGKKSVITFISSWSPASSEQIAIIDKLKTSSKMNGIIVSVGESKTKVALFEKRGKYKTPIILDSEMDLVNNYHINSMPTHYFVDEKGVIKKVVVGLLSADQLLEK